MSDWPMRFEFELAQAEQFTSNLVDRVRKNYEPGTGEQPVPRDVKVALLSNDLFEQMPRENLATLAALLLIQKTEGDLL